jgi:hypothetical protein
MTKARSVSSLCLGLWLGGTSVVAQPKADPKVDPAAARKQAIEDARKAGILGSKPPQEVLDMGKLMTGTWKCAGTVTLPDGSESKLKATMKTAPDVNGFWIHESMSGDLAGQNVKMEAYMTAEAGKWRRVAIDSFGGNTFGTSDGMKDGKMDWQLETNSGELEKAHLDASDLKKGLHVWSEHSFDKGKTWGNGPDMTCKK